MRSGKKNSENPVRKNRAAEIASRDLKENDVINNLDFYRRLQTLSEQERATALLSATGKPSP